MLDRKTPDIHDAAAAVERPAPGEASDARFGSDLIAETLSALDIPYVALNPGASYRGLHDSIVNHLGNRQPQMLLCLHEEHAVALAHGYAKVAGRPMAAIVHSNVGLMHASMAIFNAWCDRAPVLVLGATGPVDAAKRRPWIDWIHTAADQGALVRDFTKWDDQPGSVAAATEALLRAFRIAGASPKGPVYVNLDAAIQEQAIEAGPFALDVGRYAPARSPTPEPQRLSEAVERLKSAQSCVMLAGRVNRNIDDWRARIALADALDARVATDLKVGAAFPTDHPRHVGAPSLFPDAPALEAVAAADVILSLDWSDLGGTLREAFKKAPPSATVIHASLDEIVHRGWSMDHQALAPVDIPLFADPDAATRALLEALGATATPHAPTAAKDADEEEPKADEITVAALGRALRRACAGRETSLLRLPLSWSGELWPFRHPLDYLGYDGGGGVGSGPGMAIGGALALRGSGRLPVAVLGDGDFLMSGTALWTATRYRIPLLIVVANNQSFFNDEIHQDRVARMRGRPPENRWIGQRIADPDIDVASLARAQGASGFGPVADPGDLFGALQEAIAAVDAGGCAVVDVRVRLGYDSATQAAIARPD